MADLLTLAGLPLLAALGGAFFGAWLQIRLQQRSSDRRKHRDDLKKRCLAALKEGLGEFFVSELWLREDMPVFVDLPDDSLLNNAIRLAESRTGLITMQPTPITKLDVVLYKDLENHFPELWHSVTDFDSGLTSAKFLQFKTTLHPGT